MRVHVPSSPTVFAALQAQHVTVHAVLQQTPSAHAPLAHSSFDAQGDPFGSEQWLCAHT